MWVEVFKIGKHTAEDGVARVYNETDLDKMVSGYEPKVHEAPVVIGHPKSNTPAFGWVKALKRVGDVLLAKLEELHPDFLAAIKSGAYKKRSISLYPDGTLRHVGFLGAKPPAIKGLADVAFAEDSAVEIQLSFDSENPEKKDEKDEQIAALSQLLEELRAKIIELETQLAATEEGAQKQEMKEFCEALIGEGRLTPAQMNSAMNIFDQLPSDFSEGACNRTLLKSLLADMPVQVSFGEFAVSQHAANSATALDKRYIGVTTDGERTSLHLMAKEIMSENDMITYEEALGIALER